MRLALRRMLGRLVALTTQGVPRSPSVPPQAGRLWPPAPHCDHPFGLRGLANGRAPRSSSGRARRSMRPPAWSSGRGCPLFRQRLTGWSVFRAAPRPSPAPAEPDRQASPNQLGPHSRAIHSHPLSGRAQASSPLHRRLSHPFGLGEMSGGRLQDARSAHRRIHLPLDGTANPRCPSRQCELFAELPEGSRQHRSGFRRNRPRQRTNRFRAHPPVSHPVD